MPKTFDPTKHREGLVKQRDAAQAAHDKAKAKVEAKQAAHAKTQAALADAQTDLDAQTRAITNLNAMLEHFDNLNTEQGAVQAAVFVGQVDEGSDPTL